MLPCTGWCARGRNETEESNVCRVEDTMAPGRSEEMKGLTVAGLAILTLLFVVLMALEVGANRLPIRP